MHRSTCHSLGTLVWLLAASATSARAQTPTFAPVEVGTGPLLFLVHPEDAQGRPAYGPDRLEVLYVLDPTLGRPPRPVWRGHGARPSPLVRLGADLVAFDYLDRVWLVEPSTGRVTPAVATERETELVRVDGATLVVAERLVRRPSGLRLRTATPGGPTETLDEHEAQRLFVVDLATRAATPLGDSPVERVLGFEGGAVWAISSGPVDAPSQDRHVVRLRGEATERLMPFAPEWVTRETEWSVSPTGRWLALGLLDAGHDYHSERELVVYDLVEHRVALERARVAVTPFDPQGGNGPRLAVWWTDDATLATFSGAKWAGWDLRTGGAVQVVIGGPDTPSPVAEAGEYELGRRLYQPLPGGPRGAFDLEHGLVRFRGDPTPVIDVLDRDRRTQVGRVAVDDAGEWAVSCDAAGTFLVDGRTKVRVNLLPGGSYELVWLSRWP